MAALRTCVRGLADDRFPRLATAYRAFHLSLAKAAAAAAAAPPPPPPPPPSAASYFNGAQHGVARYLGNFERSRSVAAPSAERVPHRTTKSPSFSLVRGFRVCLFGFFFGLVVALSPTQYISPVISLYLFFNNTALYCRTRVCIFRRDRAFARTCTLAYSPPSSPLLPSCPVASISLFSTHSHPPRLRRSTSLSSAASSPRRSSLSVLFVRRRCSSYVVVIHGLHRAHLVFNTQAKVKNARVQSGYNTAIIASTTTRAREDEYKE